MPQKKALVLVGIAQVLFAALFVTVIALLIFYFRPCPLKRLTATTCGELRSYNLSEIDLEAVLRVEEINSHLYAWKARFTQSARIDPFITPIRRSRDLPNIVENSGGTFSGLEHLDLIGDVRPSLDYVISLLNDNTTLPKHFDARERWPLCKSVHKILNQGECGSCWAVAFTAAASDRICIHSSGSMQVQLSAQDLLECSEASSGCLGGNTIAAASTWYERGIVSGGPLASNEGCKPYLFTSDCGSPCPLLETALYAQAKLTTCIEKCRPGFYRTYNDDKYYAGLPYVIGHPNMLSALVERNLTSVSYRFEEVEKIMKLELLRNGPFALSFPAHVEFQHYGRGVYHRTPYDGGSLYGHEVKLIGWGEETFEDLEGEILKTAKITVENGKKVYSLPYWTFANSFGSDWGENGFFRVVRGRFADPQLISSTAINLPRRR